MLLLFKIGFLEVRALDVLDVLLVSLLLFVVYKMVKGSLAMNIFFGLMLVFLVWLLVRALDMHLLEGILGQFIGVGVIALLIVFQPETRRFLLFIGRGSIFTREGIWRRLFAKRWIPGGPDDVVEEVIKAAESLSRSKTGVLIVFAKTSRLQFFANTGVAIDGQISSQLFESIFNKYSPLHDGAVIIASSTILAAKCILPISENTNLPSGIGLRHRAAVGISEHSDALALVISEESGDISYAREGQLHQHISLQELEQILKDMLSEN